MRLVKRSVNQDDVSAYHLFYSDRAGTPGNDLTFFDWPVRREVRGTRSIVRTKLRVSGEGALEWWAARLKEQGIGAGEILERDGRLTLDFEDPEGQRLSLVDDARRGSGSSAVGARARCPAEHQIRGLGPHRAERAEPHPDGAGAHRGVEHARGAQLLGAGARTLARPRLRDGRGRAGRRTARRGAAGPARRAARAPAACITWRSARRTRRSTTPGPSG